MADSEPGTAWDAAVAAPFHYDAFISYRRSDGAAVARWLRRSLQAFKAPRRFAHLRERRLAVYMDTAYERGVQDFYEQTLRPALLASRHLIVLATPDAARPRADGLADWMQRELQDFLGAPQGRNVIVVRAAGDFGGELPSGLAARFPHIELVDLRGAGRAGAVMPWRSARLHDELLKIVGPLLDIAPAQMPDLRQEQERRRQARLGAWVGSGTGLALAAVAAAVMALRGEQRAVQALQDAVFATERVILAADRALEPSDEEHDARSRVLDDMCDLRSRMLAEGQRSGGPRETRICEVERARGLLGQGEAERAHDRLARLGSTLRRLYQESPSAEMAVELLRACDALADAAPRSLEGTDCSADAQAQLVRSHGESKEFRAALAGRAVSRAIAQRRKAAAALDRKDEAAAVRHWRQAAVHYGEARATHPDTDQVQRIALDEAETLIAVAAFDAQARRPAAAAQARRDARRLLDRVLKDSPQDPELVRFAAQLATRWAELPRKDTRP